MPPKYRSRGKTKNRLQAFNVHELGACALSNDGTVTAMFIDPGTKNCGIRVVNVLLSDDPFDATPRVINTVFHGLINFAQRNESLDVSFGQAAEFFRRHRNMVIDCHYIAIEEQLDVNPKAVMLQYHIIGVLTCLIRDRGHRPLIYLVNSTLKSRAFHEQGTTTKKSGILAAIRIFESRGDEEGLRLIQSTTKKDDICDVVCYEDIFWQMMRDFDIPVPQRHMPNVYII